MKLSSARHKSIPDHEQIFSHKLCTDQVICCCYWFREGMMPKQGRDFFMSNTKSCFNKEQCPIYWRVVFMMIRCSSMQLNVGIYHKYNFRCRRINCFLSFDFVLCQYIHATDLGLGDLHCRLLEKKKLHTLCKRHFLACQFVWL